MARGPWISMPRLKLNFTVGWFELSNLKVHPRQGSCLSTTDDFLSTGDRHRLSSTEYFVACTCRACILSALCPLQAINLSFSVASFALRPGCTKVESDSDFSRSQILLKFYFCFSETFSGRLERQLYQGEIILFYQHSARGAPLCYTTGCAAVTEV